MHQCKNIEELIDVVKKCWIDFPLDTCKKVWTYLQLVLDAALAAADDPTALAPPQAAEKPVATAN
jgi:hypothetical protein